MRRLSAIVVVLVLAVLISACMPKSSVRISGEYTVQAIAAERK